MLIDRYDPEDVFARVPELAEQTDPVLIWIDRLLDDDQLYAQVHPDLARRYPLTLVHGRHSTPAEVILRLLVVQHLYALDAGSYQETVQRVADSLVLRWFCRVYFQRVPAATTLLRWAVTIQPETLQALNDRVALLAKQARVTQGRKLRIDSTCVQTAIHHPTDSGLLLDGVRVLTRLIRQAKPLVAQPLASVRDAFRSRLRTRRRTVHQLHRLRRRPQPEAKQVEQQRTIYQALLAATRQTVRQAERVLTALTPLLPPEQEPHRKLEPATRLALWLHAQFERFLPLIERVRAQAHSRVLESRQVPASEKVLSLFEPHTRVIPRHKGGAAVECGRQVMLGEVEGGIIPRYHVLADGESDRHQAIPAVLAHRRLFGRAPWLLTGDRGVHTKGIEEQAQALGVRHVVIPRSGPTTPLQRERERDRTWRRRYRWRAGIEGRISSLRRDYGLARCAYHGEMGMERWVGWGIVASDLRHIGRCLAHQHARAT